MRPAVGLRDRVCEAKCGFMVAVRPFQRHVDTDAVLFTSDNDGGFDQRGLATVKVLNECLDPAFVFQHDRRGFDASGIGQHQPDPRVQESQFAQSVFKGRQVEFGHRECFGRRHKGHRSAFFAIGVADDLKRAV